MEAYDETISERYRRIFAVLPSPAKLTGRLRILSTPSSSIVPFPTVPGGDLLSGAIRSPYERDYSLCVAFVDGLLSEGPTPEEALEAVRLFCARHGIDPNRLETALATALEGGADA